MGGNQRTYLQEYDLYRLLKSILGKLNCLKQDFWNNWKFYYKFHKDILHVLILLHEWLPPYDSCSELAAEV